MGVFFVQRSVFVLLDLPIETYNRLVEYAHFSDKTFDTAVSEALIEWVEVTGDCLAEFLRNDPSGSTVH